MSPDAAKALGLELFTADLVSRRVGSQYVAHGRGVILHFYHWASAHKLPDIRTARPKDLLRFRDFLSAQLSKTSGLQLKNSSVNGRFSFIRQLYAVLYRAGIMTGNPAGQLTQGLPDNGVTRRAMTEDEIGRFLDAIDTTTAQGLRDRALFELIYAAGLRISEVAQLKVTHVDFSTRIMRIRGKGDKDRMVPISEVAKDVLLEYLGPRREIAEAWLFPGSRGGNTNEPVRPGSISERFRTLSRRFGMEKPNVSTHSVRHATASHLLDHGVNVRQVQELLGHASAETTARYTHVVTDHLRRQFQRYHPREQALYTELDPAYLARLVDLEKSE
jgi:site-specific recombinase XerD